MPISSSFLNGALGRIGRHIYSAVADPMHSEGSKAGTAYGQGRYSEALGHGLASLIPVMGPQAARAGEEIGRGNYLKGAGMGLAALPFDAPELEGFELVEDEAPQLGEALTGGHAGGGATSVEELARPGTNYTVDRGGNVTRWGKDFNPGATRPGHAHVTVLDNGQIRVNAGELKPAMHAGLNRALEATRNLKVK